MALANNITKDLNIEQITPDPVMADPELFCLCGWCTWKAGSSSFVYISADYQTMHFLCVPQPCRGITADQLIFEVDQPYCTEILTVADLENSHNFADQPVQPTLWGRSAMSASFLGVRVRQSYCESNFRSIIICNKRIRSASTGLISRLTRRLSWLNIALYRPMSESCKANERSQPI